MEMNGAVKTGWLIRWLFLVTIGISVSTLNADIDSGLIVHYPFDEEPVSGVIVDVAGGHNAVAYNVVWDPNAPSVVGESLKFDPSLGDSYLRIMNSETALAELGDEFTIALWWDAGEDAGTTQYSNQVISCQPNNELLIDAPYKSSAITYFHTKNVAESLSYAGDVNEYRGFAHWVFMKKAGSDGYMRIYRNTQLIASSAGNWSGYAAAVVTDARIGYSSKARIDDYRIYNRVLSEVEIELLYNIPQPCDTSNPLLADVNGDCTVDMIDFSVLSAEWLMSAILD